MDKCPATAELPRKECGVFVFGRHNRAVALEAPEITGHREGDQRPGARVSGVRDGILIQRRELHDARVLHSPQLLRVLLGRWGKGRLRVNLPVGDAVETSGGGQVRDTPPVLDSHEQERLPGRQQCCTRVEHRMCG